MTGCGRGRQEGNDVTTGFTAELWDEEVAGSYRSVLAHPFITGLTDGSLPEQAFSYYVVQDVLFLNRYAQALAILAGRAPDPASAAMFTRHAAGVADELELHDGLLRDLGIDPAAATAAEPAPVTLAYTSYLLAIVHGGSYAEGVGAVLPCYWIYQQVGTHLTGRGSPSPRYQRWIEAYAGDDYGADVRAVLAEADRLGADLPAAERALVRRHVRVTSRYEWMFWDAAYHQQGWPGSDGGQSQAG